MATYLDFAPGNPDLFNAHMQLVNGIAMNNGVSAWNYIKPYFVRIPSDGTFDRVDIGFDISIGFAGTFRIGTDSTMGTALPSGHIWHNLPSVDRFFMPIQICAIAPPQENYIELDITVITFDQGVQTPMTQTFAFNLI